MKWFTRKKPAEDATSVLVQGVRKGDVDAVRAELEKGVSVETTAPDRSPVLHMAALAGNIAMVTLLLDHGASLTSASKVGMVLHAAVEQGNAALVVLLLARGAAIDEVSSRGETALTKAIMHGRAGLVALLLERGAAVDVDMTHGQERPLHVALSQRQPDPAIIKLLMDRTKFIDARDRMGRTPLIFAALANNTENVALLLDRGATVNIAAEDGMTPLIAAIGGARTVDTVKLLLDRGADINAAMKNGDTALLVAATRNRLEVTQFLLARGATLATTHKNVLVAFMERIDQIREKSDACAMARLLLKHGATWGREEASSVVTKKRSGQICLEAINGWADQRDRGVELSNLAIEVIDAGVDDVRAFFKLLRSTAPVAAASIGESPLVPEQPRYRKKLCVVGPSSWGKTSLIKSLTTNVATLEHADTRTIGVDLFAWQFEKEMPPSSSSVATASKRLYDVSIWDFAGQDEYQSVHTLFYSKRTLYIVCVNLKLYLDTLDARNESAIDGFVDQYIFSRMRSICVHEPESEFVFVGTKLDLIGHDLETVGRVNRDLLERLDRRENNVVRQLDRAINELKAEINESTSESTGDGGDDRCDVGLDRRLADLEALKSKRPRVLSRELAVMSSADLEGVEKVRLTLQDLIVDSDSSFLMPPVYSTMSAFLQTKVQQAATAAHASVKSQIDSSFVSVDTLRKQLGQHPPFAALDTSDVTAILHVLHIVGDILWFDEASDALNGMVFLSPALVIDFVRKVINHELGDQQKNTEESQLQTAVREEGRVAHALLSSMELWRDVFDDKLMLQLKELLFRFQLAYPDGADGLKWDSDLIVPTYWKKQGVDSTDSTTVAAVAEAEAGEAVAALPKRVCWEYEFPLELPETLYDQLGVTSYSVDLSCNRTFTGNAFATSSDAIYHTRVAKTGGGGGSRACLRIDVAAISMEDGWQQLLWYCLNLERLLDTYPGLWVTRFAVSRDGKRFEVDRLISARIEKQSAAATTGTAHGPAQVDTELLPAEMNWYTKKSWRVQRGGRRLSMANLQKKREEGGMNQMEALVMKLGNDLTRVVVNEVLGVHTHMDNVQQSLFTLAAAAGNHRDYPALWTIEYTQSKALVSTYELQLRSHLSGRCFQPKPIKITVPGELFGQYGVVVNTGLSILTSIVPDMLGKGIVDYVVSAATNQVGRAIQVHGLVDGLGIGGVGSGTIEMNKERKLSPDETVSLLHDLLTLHDPSFKPIKMSGISGLECGVFPKTGQHIWAHRDEIKARSHEIQFRHDYVETPSHHDTQGQQHQETVAHSGNNVPATELLPPAVLPRLEPTLLEVSATRPMATLEISGAQNLRLARTIGSQSPYCKWKLVSSKGVPLVSGRTLPHERGGSKADWSDLAFILRSAKVKAPTLNGCTLLFTVKTKTVVRGVSTTIGVGSLIVPDEAAGTTDAIAGDTTAKAYRVALMAAGHPAGTILVQLQR